MPTTRSGTRSRVWSVPLKVGSLPWSAVMIMRSSSVSAPSNSGSRVVEALYVLGHAFGVAAVAVLGVEVDEVGEDEAGLHAGQGFQDGVYFGVVVGGAGRCSVMPLPSKMSRILPTATISWPASSIRSR